MSKKGVTLEEKKIRMRELFHEHGECFLLKTLEKIAPKEKGIVANSVKDIVLKLVDEGQLCTDKIGTSIYFWAFPSKLINSRKRKLEEASLNYNEVSKKLRQIEQYEQERDKTNEDEQEKMLTNALNDVTDLELEIASLKKKLEELQNTDPTKFHSNVKRAEALKEAANRWTDNIFSFKAWCKRKFFMEDKVMDKQFGIPEDFDYVD